MDYGKNKISNVADISIAGKAFVITLPITLEQLKQLEKYNPDVLLLKNGDGSLKFKVCTGTACSISKNGVCFNDATRDGRGLACMTLEIPDGVTDAKKYVADYVGQGFLNLKAVVTNLDDAIDKLKEDIAEIEGSITFVGGFNGAAENVSYNSFADGFRNAPAGSGNNDITGAAAGIPGNTTDKEEEIQ